MGTVTLLDQIQTTKTTDGKQLSYPISCLQAVISGSGSISATVIVEVSLDNQNWVTFCTFSLSGTTLVSEPYTPPYPIRWTYIRTRITAISGTNAAVSLMVGD